MPETSIIMPAATWRTLGRAGGALAGAAVGILVAKRLQETRAKAASIVLHNLLASKEDPRSLTRQEVGRLWLCHPRGGPAMNVSVSDVPGIDRVLRRRRCRRADWLGFRSSCQLISVLPKAHLQGQRACNNSSLTLGLNRILTCKLQVEDINARFGVDIATSQPADVAAMYGLFLEWSIPKGDAALTGQVPHVLPIAEGTLLVALRQPHQGARSESPEQISAQLAEVQVFCAVWLCGWHPVSKTFYKWVPMYDRHLFKPLERLSSDFSSTKTGARRHPALQGGPGAGR